jgi:hypothetical protein
MNISFTSRRFVCCVALVALGSVAYAQDLEVASDTNKTGHHSFPTVISTANNRPLYPVPEPSTGSLILLGLGGVGLAMKLRKRS